MTIQVKIRWLWRQIAERRGLSEAEGLELVRRALIAGEIRCDAKNATYLAQDESQFEGSENYGSGIDINLPAELWSTLQIDLEDENPYFHFRDQHGVYLATDVCLEAEKAYRFIDSNYPLIDVPQHLDISKKDKTSFSKGHGGAPSKIDWERCIIEAATWMYNNKAPDKQNDLIKYIANMLGDEAPSDTQLKTHLRPLWRAFRAVDQER